MQKIYIILLLSISSCLSKPQDASKDVPEPPKPLTNRETAKPAPEVVVSSTTIKTTIVPSILESTKPTENVTQNTNVTKSETSIPPQNVPIDASAKDINNKTSDKKEEVPAKTDVKKKEEDTPVIPAANKESPKTEAPPAHETKSKVDPNTPKTEVTTKPNATISSTVAPKADGEKPTLQARGFDGPSFIGGIILTLGLLAIGFMGFKYYKNQTERHYNTL